MIKALGLEQTVYIEDQPLQILKSIQLHIGKGETVAIVGASGSGKSTLLGLLAGLDVPSAGEVYIADEEITRLDEESRAAVRARQVAFIFQNFQLLSCFSALDNVALPLEMKQVEHSQAIAQDFLNKVGLSHRSQHYPHQLSGGEQQRVAIARAFACRAPILFADEPTGNLDATTGAQIADLLFNLNQAQGTTLVLVTHDRELAQRCQRQIHIHAGELVSAPL